MPRSKAAGRPVVGRIVDSRRDIEHYPQAFATFDLNFVLDWHLPKKLKHLERFLP